jgi:hypothetical protein
VYHKSLSTPGKVCCAKAFGFKNSVTSLAEPERFELQDKKMTAVITDASKKVNLFNR